MLARKWRQRCVDRNGDDSWASWTRLLISRLHVAEGIAAKDGSNRFRVGIGVENQVGLRLGGSGLAGESLVQQVVEDAARGFGLVAVVVEEGDPRRQCGRLAPRVAGCSRSERPILWVTHAQGQFVQFLLVVWQPVRLQIEQELQPVLGLAQKAISVVEDAILLIGQAADALQACMASKRVALTHLGQVAAVEQLQELDGEFDVANAAVSGLDLVALTPAWLGLLLDAPLQRLDLVDLGECQIFAIDERLDGLEEALTQPEVAGRRAAA